MTTKRMFNSFYEAGGVSFFSAPDFHQELPIYGTEWGLIRFSYNSFIKNAKVELS